MCASAAWFHCSPPYTTPRLPEIVAPDLWDKDCPFHFPAQQTPFFQHDPDTSFKRCGTTPSQSAWGNADQRQLAEATHFLHLKWGGGQQRYFQYSKRSIQHCRILATTYLGQTPVYNPGPQQPEGPLVKEEWDMIYRGHASFRTVAAVLPGHRWFAESISEQPCVSPLGCLGRGIPFNLWQIRRIWDNSKASRTHRLVL